MIGTSISMQNTELMQYPSLTICEGHEASAVFAEGKVFQSWVHYHNWKYGTNHTNTEHYDLTTEVFLGLSTKKPNMSTFKLRPSDIDDRDDILCSHFVFSKKSVHSKYTNGLST